MPVVILSESGASRGDGSPGALARGRYGDITTPFVVPHNGTNWYMITRRNSSFALSENARMDINGRSWCIARIYVCAAFACKLYCISLAPSVGERKISVTNCLLLKILKRVFHVFRTSDNYK